MFLDRNVCGRKFQSSTLSGWLTTLLQLLKIKHEMNPIIQSPTYMYHIYSLVPRPLQFFVLRFVFSIIHGSRRVVKRRRPGTLIMWMTSGGPKVHADVGGGRGPHSNTWNNTLDFIIKCSVTRQDPSHSQDLKYMYFAWPVCNLPSGLLCIYS